MGFSLEAGKNTISLPENDFKERAKRNRCRESERWDEEEGAAKCLSNPIFFRLVRYPFTRGEFDLVENYRDSYLGSNDNEPRSFFPYVIARPMTFSLRKWLQRSLRYDYSTSATFPTAIRRCSPPIERERIRIGQVYHRRRNSQECSLLRVEREIPL